MKIIDLLNKIANGEEVPKKIKYLMYEYTYNDDDEEYQRNQNGTIYGLGEDRRLDIILWDEVEIIEKNKKIEKLEHMNSRDYLENRDEYLSTKDIALDIETLRHWINKIIDKLNSMEE